MNTEALPKTKGGSWLGCCAVCRSIFEREVFLSNLSSSFSDAPCSVCNGLFHSSFVTKLKESIHESLKPYGTLDDDSEDVILPEAPSISLPGELALRAYSAMLTEEEKHEKQPIVSLEQFINQFKDIIKHFVREICCFRGDKKVEVCKEDGAMNLHIVLRSTLSSDRIPWDLLQIPTPKKIRKRFRGHACADIIGQGGDPKNNLEKRIESMEYLNSDRTQFISPSCSIIQRMINSLDKNSKCLLRTWYEKNRDNSETVPFTIYSAAWRTAFYVGGRYTKSRRDIAQTPFFVVEQGKSKRLGYSSVEEQICPVVSSICGGISKLNNFDDGNQRNQTVFGFVKFHASGREDMDVMMIASQGPHSGRPFICQIIDAFRKPKLSSLDEAILKVNDIEQGDSVWKDGKYGKNLSGVGIDSLKYENASRFSGLQAETEDKVKHYRCLCWSEKEVNEQLIASKLNKNEVTTIVQATPIRVLHRRSLANRIRYVLKMKASKVYDNKKDENHWFTIDCSTSAGTYVKEFVHGDLGRTVPSVSSILGGKVDIVQLDCMGIEL